jgi:hypothetical protein
MSAADVGQYIACVALLKNEKDYLITLWDAMDFQVLINGYSTVSKSIASHCDTRGIAFPGSSLLLCRR